MQIRKDFQVKQQDFIYILRDFKVSLYNPFTKGRIKPLSPPQ